jgi:hypothetical protein
MPQLCLGAILCLATAPTARAVILYSGDNVANQTAPDSARAGAFAAIARICNANGGGTTGSAVHLRGKYMLTADHVTLRSHVSFDGINFRARDTAFAPIKIGESDMKLFKLVDDPGLPGTPLFTDQVGDVFSTATLIGWGRGRDPDIADSGLGPTNTWTWGSGATEAKRWGTNRIDSQIRFDGPFGNTYSALVTNLDRNQGEDEAAAALFDSGSGLFVEDDGLWKLAGLTTAVTDSGSSTFGSFLSWDQNYFVRISAYAGAIEAALPDLDTFAGWAIDNSLHGSDAAPGADTDGDGISQLVEFALGGDPGRSDPDILPELRLTDAAGDQFLELVLTRPIGRQGICYTAQTTDQLSSWPSDSSGIADPSPPPDDNGDGTETLVYRRAQPVDDGSRGFLRITITENP